MQRGVDRSRRLPRLQRQRLRHTAAGQRGLSPRGEPRPVADHRRHRTPLADRALGPAAGRTESWWGSSRITCCGRSSGRRRSPMCASTSPDSRTSRRRVRSCWPPTIGVTSTWRRSPSSPHGSVAPSASWARRRSSMRRWWASWHGPSVASRWTGASGSDQPLRAAEAALRAGEVVVVLPQGTIPRGSDFFDPELKGKTGTARLAASTGAVVVPIGLWGTEKVWPRSARMPDFTLVRHPPKVTVRIGRTVDALTHRCGRRHGDHHERPFPTSCPKSPKMRTSPPPRSWRARSPLREVSPRHPHHARRQRHVAPARSGTRHRGRRPVRPQGRPTPAATPHRRPCGVPGHGHQRQDDHDAAARGRPRRRRRAGGQQRDGVQHAAGTRGRPCRRPGRHTGGARGRRDLPSPRPLRHESDLCGAAQPLP